MDDQKPPLLDCDYVWDLSIIIIMAASSRKRDRPSNEKNTTTESHKDPTKGLKDENRNKV